MTKIETVGAIQGHYVDQPCEVNVLAVTDPDLNWPESCRVIVTINPGFTITDKDGDSVDLCFGCTVEEGDKLIDHLEEAVGRAKIAMGRLSQ